MEEILYGEDNINYHNMVRAMDNVRVGEEDEVQNMVEYLTGTTTRLWIFLIFNFEYSY